MKSKRWEAFEKGSEFRILRAGAVRWYRPREKDGKRQKHCGLDVCSAFIIVGLLYLRTDVVIGPYKR